MDYLEHTFLDARSPYDYTFNFWNDYLGLSTLVSNARTPGPPFSPNSITESLKATLGLEDESPECPCVMTHGAADGDAHLDSCASCSCASAMGPYENQQHQHHQHLHHHHHHHHHLLHHQHRLLPGDRDRDRDSSLAGLELLPLERRRKQSPGGGRGKPEPKVCVFCRNNGAPEEVYGTHILKTADGRVLCPILRAYTCPLCSANGDHAHTIKYCPLSREQPGHRPSSRAARGGAAGRRLRVY